MAKITEDWLYKLEPDEHYVVRPDMRESLERYLNYGIPPGSFLIACLHNNLCEAFARADSFNRGHLYDLTGYIYNHLPSSSWGSPEKVTAWLAQDFNRQRGSAAT